MTNNWRAGKDRSAVGPWRFVVWDAEWGMGIYGRAVTINSFTQTGGGPNDSGLGSISSSKSRKSTIVCAPARIPPALGRPRAKSLLQRRSRARTSQIVS
ncbi:MAG: hypothetical protein U1F83_09780 [Verrucomicrobiota bacterium]